MERQLRDLVDQVNAARDKVGRPPMRNGDTEFGWRGFPKLSFDFLSRKAKAQLRNPETKEWVEERGDLDIPGFNEPEARAHIGDVVDELDYPEPKGSVGPARAKERKTITAPEAEDLLYKWYDFDLNDPNFLDEYAFLNHANTLLPPPTTDENIAERKKFFDLTDKLFDPTVPDAEKPTLREFLLLGEGSLYDPDFFGKQLFAHPDAPSVGVVKYLNEYEKQKALREGQPHNLPPIERQPFPSPAEVEAALKVVEDQGSNGIQRGDQHLAALADAAGYSGKPTILPKDEYDAVPTEHLYRGVKSTNKSTQYAYEMMDQLMHGEYYIGFGSKANGTYVGDRTEAESFANPKGLHPRWADKYYGDYDDDDNGEPSAPTLSHDDELDYDLESALIATKIHPDARIADWGDIPADVLGSDLLYNPSLPNDVFLWLIRNGYDGVDLRHFGELYGLAIINRLALIIRQRDQGGY